MQYQHLLDLTKKILQKTGLPIAKAFVVAETLIEAELLGHITHGLQLLEAYISELENGGMQKQGKPVILNKKAAVQVWDGRYLPGPWLVNKAIDVAIKKAKIYGTATIVIQKSHHIACLAAYLERVTQQNLMILLACSDPMNKTVAPFGGVTGVYSPNPLAIGIPTSSDPIMIDVSMSTTSNGLVVMKKNQNEKLPSEWLLKPNGEPTNNPNTFFENPPATILPLGGMDTGYKGFGLGIMVEAMTNALSGFGRAEHPTRWSGSVFLQILDPELFGGLNYFAKEMDYFKQESLKSTPIRAENPVRLPGAKGLVLKKKQLENGVELNAGTIKSLEKLAEKFRYKLT